MTRLAPTTRHLRYRALHWLLAHTQMGRAVLWNTWFDGRDFERRFPREPHNEDVPHR